MACFLDLERSFLWWKTMLKEQTRNLDLSRGCLNFPGIVRKTNNIDKKKWSSSLSLLIDKQGVVRSRSLGESIIKNVFIAISYYKSNQPKI